jgi:hypothetical protein
MTCNIATDGRECMLRHSHARHHREGSPCLACSTGISRMSRAVDWPPAAAEVAPDRPKRRGRPRKAPAVPAPAAVQAPAPALVTVDAVRQAVREALPQAEACALGLGCLAERCGADAVQLREILAAEGMTIFKNEIAFQGVLQLCVSVNKRLRSWAL